MPSKATIYVTLQLDALQYPSGDRGATGVVHQPPRGVHIRPGANYNQETEDKVTAAREIDFLRKSVEQLTESNKRLVKTNSKLVDIINELLLNKKLADAKNTGSVVSEDEPPRGSLQGSVLTDVSPNGKVEARVQELLTFWPDGSSHERNLGWSLRWSFII
ncbi:hypothetical protein NUU61_003346 [Penicillium alfredii]|uniref:Uncharacterized protein n=1 Tax=Penicillium alfredii TaxID=1506179 RepID=A0A9W9FTB1_9EURO|nr:uncharacterized protein NUU61_003346 [Penicillium alfredii]KAJ5105999.1 hypothetical protein NUU61_003346 [Penicillium alfredii]